MCLVPNFDVDWMSFFSSMAACRCIGPWRAMSELFTSLLLTAHAAFAEKNARLPRLYLSHCSRYPPPLVKLAKPIYYKLRILFGRITAIARRSSVVRVFVCPSVCWSRSYEPCKNGWTDQDAAWRVDSDFRRGSRSPWKLAILWVVLPIEKHWKSAAVHAAKRGI